MKQRKLVSIVLALVLTVLFSGVSFASTLEKIVERGELRVAVQSGAPPYAFIDKQGNPAGSMVDFTQGMADAMGVKLKILSYDWDGLIPALLSGKADILAADMTPTLKRALKVTFTDPWIYVQPCIFTTTNASFQTLEDVNKPSVTVGVLLGSTGESIAKKYLPNAKIKSYKGGGRMIVQALEAGHVDAGVNDDLAVLTVLPDYPPNSIRLLEKRLGPSKDPLAFAVQPESVNLWQWVNLYFKTIRANGTYDKNISYWMEGIEWKKDH
ncbi:ABC transporter substrate-binding protein [Geopsychrobacter electrodiphilus]|uniref:ABC transporter substrate-binding protein n=1 Tax=Geopsychrobacter electrodiphilus TaxID=225196 RepID=UPI00036BFD3F|nr:ABC transporter substrate-binding protein [Geopsychrobacter electrodiphilus]